LKTPDARPSRSSLVLWHLSAVTAVALTPTRVGVGPVWGLGADDLLVPAAIALAYAALAGMLLLVKRSQPGPQYVRLILASGLILTAVLLFVLIQRPAYSLVIASLLLVPVFAVLPHVTPSRLRGGALAFVAVVGVIGFLPATGLVQRVEVASRAVESQVITTGLNALTATYYRDRFGVPQATGGALATFADGYLLATGDGQLHFFYWEPGSADLDSRQLGTRIPMNLEDFVRGTSGNPAVEAGSFRTADILVQQTGDRFRLFASHHYWHADASCFTIRLSELQGTVAAFLGEGGEESWSTMYESAPCLEIKDRGLPFAGIQIGGRLEQLDEDHLLLAVGDQEFDGVEGEPALPQDEEASYGKTVLVNLRTGQSSLFTIGHRNPQGLHVDAEGTVWSTEHGPRGGDELNILVRGRNYGWPLVTYGIDYALDVWPWNPRHGRHEGFEPPMYAWMPSVSVTQVIRVRGRHFSEWQGDLLVASLSGALWRVRLEQQRVTVVERIQVGGRIRDLIEDAEGRLLLWTEQSNIGPTRAGLVTIERRAREGDAGAAVSAERGQLAYARCSGCHRLEAEAAPGVGPDLAGIAGRPIASISGFGYSEALAATEGTWTDARLDAFLANPQAAVPGTSMRTDGISDPAERASLVAFLRTLR
jgi:aldose sugar dehydrogenase